MRWGFGFLVGSSWTTEREKDGRGGDEEKGGEGKKQKEKNGIPRTILDGGIPLSFSALIKEAK